MITFSARDSAWNARPYSLTGLLYDKPDQSQIRLSAMVSGAIPKATRSQFTLQYSLVVDGHPSAESAPCPPRSSAWATFPSH